MTLKERVAALAGVPLFAGLPRRSLERIARASTELEAPAGQVLIEPRTPGSGMFVLLAGEASVEVRGGKRRTVSSGECFGELALLAPDGERGARIRTTMPVRCLAIARSDFRRLLDEEPKLAVRLLETLAARLAANE